MKPNLEILEKAILSLEESIAQPLTVFIQDSVIQRFVYTFELASKAGKISLEHSGVRDTSSPRAVIRNLGVQGWIPDVERWMKFLEVRNLSTHIYKEEIAKKVFAEGKAFPLEARKLLESLKKIE
jgi:nucleotidyltransferase substrate binding protein (TIGR01987 family)